MHVVNAAVWLRFTASFEHNSRSGVLVSFPANIHITVIAAICTADAPVPPFLIYPGEYLLEEWVHSRDTELKQMATVTTSGYTNNYTAMRWLEDCFDPSSRVRAGVRPTRM